MNYEFYKVLHLLGIISLFLAWGGLLLFRFAGLDKAGDDRPAFRILMITHGLALVTTLVAGFGLVARLGLGSPWPTWVLVKLGVWLCLAIGLVFVKKFPRQLSLFWLSSLALGFLAAYMAIMKPL